MKQESVPSAFSPLRALINKIISAPLFQRHDVAALLISNSQFIEL
jgi:hypothetical protein